MTETFDVAIVGAGVHGASAAFHLASRGVKPVIFERLTPAGGPTGRSSAVCRSYYTNPFLARAARDSMAMMRDFRSLTGADAGFRATGLLYLHPPEDEEAVRVSVDRLNGLGIATDLFDLAGLAATYPRFSLDGVGVGALERGAGYADPYAVTEGLFRRAVELGATARLGQTVVGLEASESGAVVICVDGTRTSCGRVLIAAGPWTGPLAAQVGPALPLTVERHVVATFRWAGAQPVAAHGNLIGGYYFRPEGEDLYLVGSVHPAPQADPDDFDQEIREDEVRALAEAVVRRVPHLAAVGVPRGMGEPVRREPRLAADDRAGGAQRVRGRREPAGTDSSWRPRSASTSPTWSWARRTSIPRWPSSTRSGSNGGARSRPATGTRASWGERR